MEPAVASFVSTDRKGNQRFLRQPQLYLPKELSRQKETPRTGHAHSSSTSSSGHKERRVEDGSLSNATPPGRPLSNLQRFLDHTTPRIPSQLLSKTHVRDLSLKGCVTSTRQFFSLCDLWEYFDEWSAYGAGVPIVLNGNETVMQYYVPYLSALQLYTSSESVCFAKNRRLGDDSDSSETDFRDTGSEASSDGEAEKLSARDVRNWNLSVNCGQSSIRSAHGDRSSLGLGGGLFNEEALLWQAEDRPEFLLYEFFETTAPSLRVPLHDKVDELARGFRALRTLHSSDLSRSSWLSVAWYPIYRIPAGPNLKDLAACFLTYHPLSPFLADDTRNILSAFPEDSRFSPKGQVALHSFGLASYKFRGAIWTSAGITDRHLASGLQRSSDDVVAEYNDISAIPRWSGILQRGHKKSFPRKEAILNEIKENL